jgi:3-phenylpropionate/trans-cinnamate dioxygenase ferredoxin subunit
MSNESDSADLPGSAGAFVDVGAAEALPEGTMRGVDVAGERVLVARVAGCVYAVGGFCSHQIAHLEDGVLEDRIVRCPRHWAGFDLTTGEPICAPAEVPLPVYDVKVEGGRLLVSLRPPRR